MWGLQAYKRVLPMSLRRMSYSVTHSKAHPPPLYVDKSHQDLLSSLLLKPQPPLPDGLEKAKNFWEFRNRRYIETNAQKGNPWNLYEMFYSLLVRSMPVKLTLKLLGYNFLVSLPLVWVSAAQQTTPPPALFDSLLQFLPTHMSESEIFQSVPLPPVFLIEISDFLQDHSTISALASINSWLAAGMFLMLSFRINRATSRWWEANSLAASFHTDSYSLFSGVRMYVKDARQQAQYGLEIVAIVRSLQYQLCDFDEERWRQYFSMLLVDTTRADAAASLPLPPSHLYEKFISKAPRFRTHFLMSELSANLGHCFDHGGIPAGIRALCQLKHRLEVPRFPLPLPLLSIFFL